MSGFVYGIAATLFFQAAWSYFRSPRIKVNEAGHWQYPIDTLAQMIAIPAERRERFLAELPAMLRHIWALMDRYPLATLPGTQWVDDGLGEFRPNVKNAPDHTAEAFAARPLAQEP